MQVQDRVAVGTDEVYMGIGIGIEPFNAPDSCNALDHALGFEPGQIPVDRCQRDIRMFFLKHLMNHLRRGVRIGFPKDL